MRDFLNLYLLNTKKINIFSMPEEVAARCFERVVQQQTLKNQFLVAGTLKSKTAELGLYPKQDEANAVAECWLDYFQSLGQALR